jgi:hypothetical protein
VGRREQHKLRSQVPQSLQEREEEVITLTGGEGVLGIVCTCTGLVEGADHGQGGSRVSKVPRTKVHAGQGEVRKEELEAGG